MKRILLLLLVFLSCASYLAKSQGTNEKDEALRKAVFDPAEFIFEGTVLETHNFVSKKGQFLSSAVVQVHKVFRGQLQAGTVEVITSGSGEFYIPETNETIYYDISHGTIKLIKGYTSLFLGRIDPNINSESNYRFTNSSPIYLHDLARYYISKQFFYLPYSAAIKGTEVGAAKEFVTLQDLYNYILEEPNTKFNDLDQKEFKKESRQKQPEPEKKEQKIQSNEE